MSSQYKVDDANFNLRILLVDDIPFQLTEIKHNLISLGHDFVDVDSPLKAIELIKSENQFNPFDLVITDMKMPFMDGIELTKEIHKIRPDLPVAMLTVENNEDEMLKIAKQAELIDYITKDESLESLEFSLNSILADKIAKMQNNNL